MAKMCLFYLTAFLLVSVTLCRNIDQFPDCNDLGCPEDIQPAPVCGTDGKNYASQCHMDLDNKKRICWLGHFNIIYKLHDGPCSPTTTVVFTG